MGGFAVEGGGERFIPLDSPFALTDSPHPPIFAAIFRRTTGVKVDLITFFAENFYLTELFCVQKTQKLTISSLREKFAISPLRENRDISSPRENRDISSPRENWDISSPRENWDISPLREKFAISSLRENRDISPLRGN
ncbi:unnamed protein product [Meloidogyne enterolobii]|uniref:Uncharacterized protein n=1 Tax=Meloidogyne enterolobii TaxID=390850 RepID=A0ACB1ARB6_MELEN